MATETGQAGGNTDPRQGSTDRWVAVPDQVAAQLEGETIVIPTLAVGMTALLSTALAGLRIARRP